MTEQQLYCDGGCIGRNPSRLGGTYAWLLVEGGELVVESSGAVLPGELGVEAVTNNQTELLAALLALEHVGRDWTGTLYTDSLVTLHRLTSGRGFENVPWDLHKRVMKIRRERRYNVVLVAGHPTRAELREGLRRRNGLIASPWNVMCDALCRVQARRVQRR